MSIAGTGAALLRQVMTDRGLSQRDVEHALGAVHSGLVARWISTSDPRAPSLAYAHRLETEYGIPTEAWLDAPVDVESPEPAKTEAA